MLLRTIQRQRRPARDSVHQQFAAIRIGPKLHVLQHPRIQIRGFRINSSRSVRQQSLPSLRVGNDADTRYRERLPESLVVPKEKPFVLFQPTAQRAAELISSKRRRAALIEISRSIESAVPQKF